MQIMQHQSSLYLIYLFNNKVYKWKQKPPSACTFLNEYPISKSESFFFHATKEN